MNIPAVPVAASANPLTAGGGVPVVRFATDAHIRVFYPAGFPHTVRAWAVELDGEAIGIGGIAYRPAPQQAYFFSDIKPALARFPKLILRASRAFLAEHARPGLCAFTGPHYPTGPRLLEHLGFRFVMQGDTHGVYVWPVRTEVAA